MKEGRKSDQIGRVLQIYSRLAEGYIVKKAEEAERFGVNVRSIARDIDDIRTFLDADSERTGVLNTVIYDRKAGGYRLKTLYQTRLKNSEVLALCKVLLDSRAFPKSEMTEMLDKLISCSVPKASQKKVRDLISNEVFHYVEPRHRTNFIETMWELGLAISDSKYIEVEYCRMKGKKTVCRKLQPLSICFSEYYFYLTAFIDDEDVRKDFDVLNDSFPTIYRIDRIKQLKVLDEHYHIPYRSRFEEGEFRKRIQFMYGGRLRTVTFRYTGPSVEAVLDRLPTAEILETIEKGWVISAEVFGDGIDMWLRSQGSYVEVID